MQQARYRGSDVKRADLNKSLTCKQDSITEIFIFKLYNSGREKRNERYTISPPF